MFIFRFLIICASVLSLILIGVVAYVNVFDAEHVIPTSGIRILTNTGLSLLILIFILSTVYFIQFLVRAIYRPIKFGLSLQVFNDTSPLTLVLAIASAVILFSNSIKFTLALIFRLFADVIISFLRLSARLLTQGFGCAENSEFTNCVPQLIYSATDGTQGLLELTFFRQNTGIASVPFLDLLLLFIYIVVFCYVINYLKSKDSISTRIWLFYSVLSFVAVYLALSATLAVPLFNAKPTDGATALVSLQKRISSYGPTIPITANASDSHGDRGAGPLSQTQLNDKSNTNINNQISDRLSIISQEITRQLGRVRDRRLEMVSGYESYRKSLQANVQSIFEIQSANRLGEREQSLHQIDLFNWYKSRVDTRVERMNACGRAEQAYLSTLGEIDRFRSQVTTKSYDNVEYYFSRMEVRRQEAEVAEEKCLSYILNGDSPPHRRTFGDSLGPVGSAVKWLLSSESIEVALIVGLLGFGMLGALVSRFVRSASVYGRVPTTIGDAAAVLFSGLVAAIVVFVGSYAGISIFATSGGEPNPFAVFFLCIGAAVFSDSVWEKVRGHVTNNIQPESVSSNL